MTPFFDRLPRELRDQIYLGLTYERSITAVDEIRPVAWGYPPDEDRPHRIERAKVVVTACLIPALLRVSSRFRSEYLEAVLPRITVSVYGTLSSRMYLRWCPDSLGPLLPLLKHIEMFSFGAVRGGDEDDEDEYMPMQWLLDNCTTGMSSLKSLRLVYALDIPELESKVQTQSFDSDAFFELAPTDKNSDLKIDRQLQLTGKLYSMDHRYAFDRLEQWATERLDASDDNFITFKATRSQGPYSWLGLDLQMLHTGKYTGVEGFEAVRRRRDIAEAMGEDCNDIRQFYEYDSRSELHPEIEWALAGVLALTLET